MFEICVLIYLVGVLGALVGSLDLRKHNYTHLTMRPKPVIALIILTPFLNHWLMWECFKEVSWQKRVHSNRQLNFKKRMSQVTRVKGIS